MQLIIHLLLMMMTVLKMNNNLINYLWSLKIHNNNRLENKIKENQSN